MRELRKRMRRLCSLILAAVLLLTGISPVMAQEETGTHFNLFDLKVGQILQPKDVIDLPRWYKDEMIIFYDYKENGIDIGDMSTMLYNGCTRTDSHIVVRSYSTEGEEGLWYAPSALSPENFGGWKVMNRMIGSIESGSYGFMILMAVPKNADNSYVCDADITADQRSDGETKAIPVPENAGVEFYGFDINTGEPLKKDENGALIAAPGDVVYAYTKPVPSFYSEIRITTGGKDLGMYNVYTIQNWKNVSANPDKPLLYKTEGKKEVSKPELSDAVSAFVMPHGDVTVQALYHKTDLSYSVAYHTSSTNTADVLLEEVPLNTVLTTWDPEKDPVAGCSSQEGKSILYWERGRVDGYNSWYDTYECYERGESFTVVNAVRFIARKNQAGYKIETAEDAPVTPYYSNARQTGPKIQAQWAYPDKETSFVFEPEAVRNGKSLKSLQINDEPCITMGENDYTDHCGKVADADLRITAQYYDEEPVNLTLDLSKGEATLTSRDEDLSEEEANGYRFLVSFLDPFKNSHIDGIKVLMPAELFHTGITETTGLVDLNHDGKYDLQVKKALGKQIDYMLFRRLPAAKYCDETILELPCNQGGYGTFTIKLYDTCKIEYINDGKTVWTQDGKIGASLDAPSEKAAVSREGYTLKGWAETPDGKTLYDFSKPVGGDLKLYAVWEKNPTPEDPGKTDPKPIAAGDVIRDAASGHLYVVTKAGQNGEVKLLEAVAKKGSVKVPDAIVISGILYKVTAIDKKAFKKVSSIKTLNLGVNITKLKKGTFKKCKKLKTVRIRNKKKVIALNKNTFGKRKGKILLKVPKNMVRKYKQYIKKKKLTGRFRVKKG